MLGNGQDWVWLALLVTPGWFAVRGWHGGRAQPLPTPFTEWLPLALAIGLAWSGALLVSGSVADAAAAIATGRAVARVTALLAGAGVLWLVPFGLGWIGGWLSRKRPGATVTVVRRNGAAVTGKLHHTTATELVVSEATFGDICAKMVTINRSDVELVLNHRRGWSDSALSERMPRTSEQSDSGRARRTSRAGAPLAPTRRVGGPFAARTIGQREPRPASAGEGTPLAAATDDDGADSTALPGSTDVR